MASSQLGPLASLEAETVSSAGLSPALIEVLVPGLVVLFHPELRRIGERAVLLGLGGGGEALSRATPLFAQPGSGERRPLADPHLSRAPFHLAAGRQPGAIAISTAGSRASLVIDGEPLAGERELPAEAVREGVVLTLASQVVLLLTLVDPSPPGDLPAFGLVGESPRMVRLRQEIRRVAPLAVPALLRGETGTGKELVARALHQASPWRGGPFVALNLGAIPPTLAAAELFGAERGAFTGADRRRAGAFERAHGGTLFLDELGEAPAEVQVLLLRALESRTVRTVGGDRERPVEVRVVAATDADLDEAIRAGRFRAPLLHRLSGYEIALPPLGERREDFGRLLLAWLKRELGEPLPDLPWLSAPLVARLAAGTWPGNVRQLGNVVRQLAVLGRDTTPGALLGELHRLLAPTATTEAASPTTTPAMAATPASRPVYRDASTVSEEELQAALTAHGYRLQRVAAALGVARPSLYDRIAKSSVARKAADLSRAEIAAAERSHDGELAAMAAALGVSVPGLRRRQKQLGMR